MDGSPNVLIGDYDTEGEATGPWIELASLDEREVPIVHQLLYIHDGERTPREMTTGPGAFVRIRINTEGVSTEFSFHSRRGRSIHDA